MGSKRFIELTTAELIDVIVALRLRAEACDDNGETKKAAKWRAIVAKFEKEI